VIYVYSQRASSQAGSQTKLLALSSRPCGGKMAGDRRAVGSCSYALNSTCRSLSS
jgi:hypothetical protein